MLPLDLCEQIKKENPPSFQLHFHRKCGILWNRYGVGTKVWPAQHPLFLFPYPKQISTPLSRKMWHFVEKIPGTAIKGSIYLSAIGAIALADCFSNRSTNHTLIID